jgi:hypothetical protein
MTAIGITLIALGGLEIAASFAAHCGCAEKLRSKLAAKVGRSAKALVRAKSRSKRRRPQRKVDTQLSKVLRGVFRIP